MISAKTRTNIKKSIIRTRAANLNTAVVLVACCFVDGLGREYFSGGSEYRFKRYIEIFMPETFLGLEKRSIKLKKRKDFCLHALWRDIRCGLVHEVDPKSRSAILGRGKEVVHQNIKDKRYPGKDLVLSSPRFIDNFLGSLDKLP